MTVQALPIDSPRRGLAAKIAARVPAVALSGLCLCLAACGDPEQPGFAVVVDVSGSGLDAGLADSASPTIAAQLPPDSLLYVNQVRADSAADPTCPPVQIDLRPPVLIDNSEVDEPERRRVLGVADSELDAFLDCARENPGKGSDILGAIQDAASHLSTTGLRRLLIMSDGHNNTAPLVLKRKVLAGESWDPAEAVATVREAGLLPVLDGVEVLFAGLGEDGRDNDPVVSQRLRDFWLSYARAAGADSVTITHPAETNQGESR